jgi:SAM-dependent methyltransferase
VSTEDEIRRHYALGEERDRLLSPFGQVEFARTCEIVERALPPPPALVADVGGGPGRYSLWLAGLGYRVLHRDLVQLHVEQVSADAADAGLQVETGVADARDLDLNDASVDAVLLLGPIYHLPTRDDRVAALAEGRRVVRPGGPVFAVAISRWAPRLHGEVAHRLGEEFETMREAPSTKSSARAGSSRSSTARSAATATARTSCAGRSRRPGSSSSTSPASRGSPSRCPTSRSGWARPSCGRSCWAPRGRWSAFRSSWASARTSWRPHDAPDLCSGSRFARLRGSARERVVFENSAVWRSTGSPQVAAVD